MATQTNTGFTIIETMLFLAISAALFAAVMVGVGANIERQRYRDSVVSLRSFIQEQYSRTANTANGRTDDVACNLSGSSIAITGTTPGAGEAPGTSKCLIVGRYIEVDDYGTDTSSYGKTLLVSNVIAYPRRDASCSTTTNGDLDDLKCNYVLQRGTKERESYAIAWGNKLVSESNPAAYKQFSMMIVRSPRSGALMTLVSPNSKISTTNLPKATNPLRQALHLCVNGNPAGVKPTGVNIPALTAAQSMVSVMTDTESVCG